MCCSYLGHQGTPKIWVALQRLVCFPKLWFGREEVGCGGGRRDAAGWKTIHLFPEIIPLAVFEVKGCHVTCCQVPKSARGKMWMRKALLKPGGLQALPCASADIWRAAVVDLSAVRLYI